ncbi:MAG TPA: PD-(D/E)XK nuclease family protein, partial [Thermoanaerobaculaceae bacterium]|nr:PD-(D/E)XK nuclease family protein [Thermoanaerobaculaceae bacterium]
VTGAVRDLLDAGFTSAHHEAVLERLAELGHAGEPTLERVRAIVGVAADLEEEVGRLGLGGTAALLRRATALLTGRGSELLPSNAVFIHGFAEATGLALDFLEVLVREYRARVFVDEPADPARPAEPDSGVAFTRRLRERLAGWRGESALPRGSDGAGTLRFLSAEGLEGEVRAVGTAVRALLDQGVVPEEIGVVARQVASWEAAVTIHWDRLGIPYALEGGRGLLGPAGRQMVALGELLRRGSLAPVDAWLTARGEEDGGDDLRLALSLLGAATVGQVAVLEVPELLGGAAGLGLPVRTGLSAEEDGDSTRLVAHRRWVTRGRLDQAVASARRVSAVLLPRGSMSVGRHLANLRELVKEELRDHAGGRQAIESVIADLAGSLPKDFELDWPELVVLVRRALAAGARDALAGSGAGVRVLGVTQARGLTFEHLFIIGLNRDVFPRIVNEDPLLPDWVRGALLPVLPDLHTKAGGHDEERYLFAHLVGAASHVTLSWQVTDDEARAVPQSPFIQRLRLARPELSVEVANAKPGASGGGPATGLEHAVAAGLAGDRLAWEATVAVAMAEGDAASADRAHELARVRARVLEEVDPVEGWAIRSTPSPYLGLVGSQPAGGDLEGLLFVTTLEAMSRCPWQTFLRRVLKVEPPRDPGQELGGFDSRLLGSVVHGALAAIAVGDPGVSRGWEEVVEGAPLRAPWPSPARLEALAAGVARDKAQLQGGLPPGLVLALTRRAVAWLQEARRLDWSVGEPTVLGAEVPGRVAVRDPEGRPRWLRFTCDRVDRAAGGGVVGTDYKSGRPIPTASGKDIRRKQARQAIQNGKALQAAAYAGAAGASGLGRYLYLDPDVDDRARELAIAGDDTEMMADLQTVVSALLGAWDSGVFLPRLTAPEGGDASRACGFCEMREACVQYDSGMRRRLLAWVGAPPVDRVSAVATQLWNLGAVEPGEDGGA